MTHKRDVANAHLPGLTEADRDTIRGDVERAAQALLDALRIDWRNDHNTERTPARYAKMLVDEVFSGRYRPMPAITDFPNVRELDQLYTVGPITVRSTCSHHFAPIMGRAWIGVLPSDRVIGLSKFVRLAEWIMARPQIQEEATVQLADALESAMAPRGLGVVVRAEHLCMTMRGVREHNTEMVTSVVRGDLLTNPAIRAEFLSFVNSAQQGVPR